MLQLLADRFLCDRGRWFDIATARPVSVRLMRADGSTRGDQFEWSDHCAALSRLRHPLLNPLLDYGYSAANVRFEAYAIMPPLAAGAVAASHAAMHAVRFLRAHAISLSRERADVIVRPIQPGGRCGRAVGVVLQHRRVLDALTELFDGGGCGPVTVMVAGPPRSGITTVKYAFARMARLAGFLPVSAEAATRWPQLQRLTAGRHLCVISGDESRRDIRTRACWLARLGIESTRRHLHLTFVRSADVASGALHLERLGVAAMTSMVYVDPDVGPSAGELFTAARVADGWPGRFLAALHAEPFDRCTEPSASTVHEASVPYVVLPPETVLPPEGGSDEHLSHTVLPADQPPPRLRRTADPASAEGYSGFAEASAKAEVRRGKAEGGSHGLESASEPPRPRRMASALARAERRAIALAAGGRHGAATRLLERAIRLFQTRGQPEAAASCALALGWIVRSRGDCRTAHVQVERARALTADPRIHCAASTAIGVLWTDEGRYLEAEAALRSAVAGALTLDDRQLAGRGAIGLARALLWQARPGEALAALDGLGELSSTVPLDTSCEALTLTARIHATQGDFAAALGHASRALDRAIASHDRRLEASARRAMALALDLAGDVAGAEAHIQSGLRAAAAAHLPLMSLRLRALWLTAIRSGNGGDARAAPLRESLQRALARRRLPNVIRMQISAACDDRRGYAPRVKGPAARRESAEVVAELVDVAQRAADDRAALTSVLEAIADRVHASSMLILAGADGSRVMAMTGRPWRERSSSARRALDTGLTVPIDRAVQPPEAAEPVKYAGDTIAAIACRWPAGHLGDPSCIASCLSAGALALSTPVQTLLEVRETPPPTAWGDLLGESAAAASLREAVQRAARAPFPVLIEGESGSGKELVARATHRLGPRRDRRFCAINCAAITDELVEAELFGHAKGAFTGAAADRPGLFEEADGGSLFLDEIGELSARAQAKLLRVLQDGEVRRVGENFPRRVDVRLIAATNRRLEQEVAGGRFRADLRFRLDVVRITVPPLRERVADIPVLAAHFWHEASARVGSRATLGPDTLAALSRYDWPGNVRELQNAIAWIAVHAPRRGKISASSLPSRLAAAAPLSAGSFEAAREDFERRFVRAALAQTGGHRARTAEVLGVSRQGLAKMMRRLRIEE